MIKSIFTAKDGKEITLYEYSDVVNPRGVIQIVHGMAEHALRYDNFAKFLNQNGYVVVADDHRGHGETDKDSLGYSKGDMFSLILSDEEEITRYVKEKYNLPIILFGHSFGSFIAQAYIEKYSQNISGAIIGGSNYMKNLLLTCGRIISKIGYAIKGEKAPAKLLHKITFDGYEKKLGGSFISSIPEENERYDSDKYCGFVCSYNFYKSMFLNTKKLYNKKVLSTVKIPVLLIAGCNDPVGDFAVGVSKLEDRYLSSGINVKTYLAEGVRHEYLNDINADVAMDKIKDFADGVIDERA